MASVSQVVSEIAHSLGQPNNYALRENIKVLIFQTRNEIVRHSFEKHGYTDKVLTQRYKVSLEGLMDGDLDKEVINELVGGKYGHTYRDAFIGHNTSVNHEGDAEYGEGLYGIPDYDYPIYARGIRYIKRTTQKVPKPVRLTNNLPFDRVSTVGYYTNREIPFIKETSARFRKYVPGLQGMPCYDYINGYIYIFPSDDKPFTLQKIVIESVFENPREIEVNSGELSNADLSIDDNEWVISEDMLGQIKDIIYKRDLLTNVVRETNEIPNILKVK